MRAPTSTWDNRLLVLSPKEQREWWLNFVKSRMPHGMAVNCRYMPSLGRTPILKKLVDDGLLIRVREYNGGNCNRTVLYHPDLFPAKS